MLQFSAAGEVIEPRQHAGEHRVAGRRGVVEGGFGAGDEIVGIVGAEEISRRRGVAVVALDNLQPILRGGQIASGAFTPPGISGYTCQTSVPYDLVEARRLLAEAGYPGGEGFPKA